MQKYILDRSMNERTEASLTTYGDEVVISTHPWLISSIVNVFRLAEQFYHGASRQCMQSSVTLASAAACLSLPRKQGTGGGPREKCRSDSPHQSFSVGHIVCTVQAA